MNLFIYELLFTLFFTIYYSISIIFEMKKKNGRTSKKKRSMIMNFLVLHFNSELKNTINERL